MNIQGTSELQGKGIDTITSTIGKDGAPLDNSAEA